jgi:FkbM family methyltransferase
VTTVRSILRGVYHRSGVRRAHVAAHRTALKARSGVIRNSVGTLLHADPTDERASLLAMRRGALDRDAIAVWRRLAAELRPTIAIDVGANYGEVAFGARYHGLRGLHLVEPNPAVVRWLRRTVESASRDYPDVVLHVGAASDAAGAARLHLHGHSGGSSLNRPATDGIVVDTFRLDERIYLRDDDSLLFKIDVEGHEQAVLEGMSGLLTGRPATGLCEVLHADDALVEYLCERFAVNVVRDGVEVPVDTAALRTVLLHARDTEWAGLSKDVVLRSR